MLIVTRLEAFPTGMRVAVANCSRRHRCRRAQSRCRGGLIIPLKEMTSFILPFCTPPKEAPFIGSLLCNRTLNGVFLTLALTGWYHGLILITSEFCLAILILRWIPLTERLAPMVRFAGISGVGPVLP